MTQQRIIDQGVLSELEQENSAEALVVFLEIYHKNFKEPIRVVSDPQNFILEGKEYQGFEFDITLLSDNDRPPQAKLTIQNVEKLISESIIESTTPINLNIFVVALSEFNEFNSPLTQRNNDVKYVYKAEYLRLVDVTGTVLQITGTIRSWDYTQLSWPSVRTTQDKFPALYWN